ncbi:MAG: PDZ domain-containing protein [Gammaproteobacteria bacterium]|nr:PDZ domain-containing protein [Gammaproteobacteria bacterium]
MSNRFELSAAFIVERLGYQIWEALKVPETFGEHFDLPWLHLPVASARPPRAELRGRDPRNVSARVIEPAGARVAIDLQVGPLDASGWPIHVRLVQTSEGLLQADLEPLWPYTVSDLQLLMAHDVRLPMAPRMAVIGARFAGGDAGLSVCSVVDGGPAQRCGLAVGDLLIAIDGVRILDFSGLDVALTLLADTAEIELCWARGRQCMSGTIALEGASENERRGA